MGDRIENCKLGYSSASVASPDSIAEVALNTFSGENLIISNSQVNPSTGILTTGFNQAGNYVISYNQDFATGTVHIFGDYTVAASTLTLDYSTNTYASSATGPQLMRGAAHTATVNYTNDANAVSQLITITFDGSNWVVTGSSTPGTLCTIAGASGGTANCPHRQSAI